MSVQLIATPRPPIFSTPLSMPRVVPPSMPQVIPEPIIWTHPIAYVLRAATVFWHGTALGVERASLLEAAAFEEGQSGAAR